MPIIYNNTPLGLRGAVAGWAGQQIAAQQDAYRAEEERAQLLRALGSIGGTVGAGISAYKQRQYDEQAANAARVAEIEDMQAKFGQAEYMAQFSSDLAGGREREKFDREQAAKAEQEATWGRLLGGGAAPASPTSTFPGAMDYQGPAVQGPAGPRPAGAQVEPDWKGIAAHLASTGKAIPADLWNRAYGEAPSASNALRERDLNLRTDVFEFNKGQAAAKANEPQKPTATTRQLAKVRAVTLASDPASIAKVIDDPEQAGKPGQQAAIYALVDDDQITPEQRIDLAGRLARVPNPTPARRAIVQAMARKADEQFSMADRANAAGVGPAAPTGPAAAPNQEAAVDQAIGEGITDPEQIKARVRQILGGQP